MEVYKKTKILNIGFNKSRRNFLKKIAIISFVVLESCKKDDSFDPNDELSITGIYISPFISAQIGEDLTFRGKGVIAGDIIRWIPLGETGRVSSAAITFVTDTTFTFALPDGLSTGRYKLELVRGEKSIQLAAAVTLDVILNVEIPDKKDMTVKGLVSCDGRGVANVVVSDGYLVAKTDENGIYYLPSQKLAGYVFISVPGNYEVTNNGSSPQFFKKVSDGAVVERKDFSLIKANNDKHVVLAMTDFHLADRNNDLTQFDKCVTDINGVIAQYKNDGVKVYGLTLGDLTWDGYWYDKNFRLPEYLDRINKVSAPVFNCMGNHDNDPYCANDWLAQQPYRNIIGPNYYSFNLGKVHYVVLDNIEYLNTGGSQGKIGNRNYNNKITQEGMNWLTQDLATITDKTTPIVVAMHIQLHRQPAVSDSTTVSLANGQDLINALSAFSNVNVLTGHTHINYMVKPKPSLTEHNIAAICATWWWTGKNNYANNHICKDGSVGGYKVFEMNNKNIQWYYKSVGYSQDYQFRTYDLNETLITAAKYAPKADTSYANKLSGFAGEYASASSNNDVLINVFGYDKDWKIEVTENGAPLQCTRVSANDPLHIISYEAQRLNVNADPTSDFNTSASTHMFKVKASSSNSPLVIKVTDCFNKVYTETMGRPKALTTSMK